MRIEQLLITALKPYKNNARLHPQHQLQQITDSIKEFGFNNPILIDENNQIIAGHGRLEAAKKLNLENVPCITLPHLNTAQKKAYIIADNKIALNASWDFDLLKVEFESLQDDNFDVALTGFDADELNSILNPEILNEGLCDADEVPEIKADPITKLGDIWILGNHRLMCGDSTIIDDVNRLFQQKAKLCFTSPPYSDQRDYIDNINLDIKHISSFIRTSFNRCEFYSINLGISRKNHEIIPYWNDYINEAKDCGLKLLSWNVWDKGEAGSIGNQNAMFAISHEFIFFFGLKSFEINKTVANKSAGILSNHNGNRQKDGSIKKAKERIINDFSNLKTVLNITPQKARDEINHPARFPVELPEAYLLSCTNVNDVIYDPFGGSGTTLIACEKLGRKCLMMELSPQYCDIIIKRWQKFTGKKAILESTGEAYEEIVRS